MHTRTSELSRTHLNHHLSSRRRNITITAHPRCAMVETATATPAAPGLGGPLYRLTAFNQACVSTIVYTESESVSGAHFPFPRDVPCHQIGVIALNHGEGLPRSNPLMPQSSLSLRSPRRLIGDAHSLEPCHLERGPVILNVVPSLQIDPRLVHHLPRGGSWRANGSDLSKPKGCEGHGQADDEKE